MAKILNYRHRLMIGVSLPVICFPLISFFHFNTTPDSPIHINSEGKLEYKADEKGDRIPDFSFCGYMASETPIPDVPVKVIVPAMDGDATETIQTAIDYVSSLPLDYSGFRGTVLLEKGTYKIAGSLMIKASGVVLRGGGCNNDGTTLIGAGADRETLIRIAGGTATSIDAPFEGAAVAWLNKK